MHLKWMGTHLMEATSSLLHVSAEPLRHSIASTAVGHGWSCALLYAAPPLDPLTSMQALLQQLQQLQQQQGQPQQMMLPEQEPLSEEQQQQLLELQQRAEANPPAAVAV